MCPKHTSQRLPLKLSSPDLESRIYYPSNFIQVLQKGVEAGNHQLNNLESGMIELVLMAF